MTNEEFLAEMRNFHDEVQRAADEWAAWRERQEAKRENRAKQPGLPEMFAMLQEILSQIAELKAAKTAN